MICASSTSAASSTIVITGCMSCNSLWYRAAPKCQMKQIKQMFDDAFIILCLQYGFFTN